MAVSGRPGLPAAAELGAEGLQRRVDPPTKEACGLHGNAMKKFLKALTITAVVLALLAAAAIAAAYLTFCGGHPHGLC